MIRYSGTVVYLDGRREPFETGLRGARAWEAYAARHELPLNPTRETIERFPVQTWTVVIAHAALNVELGVEPWSDTIEGIDDWNAVDVPPTRAGVSAAP